MIKKTLIVLHCFLFILIGCFYKFGWVELSERSNKEQFSSYTLKSHCPPDYIDFTYCLSGDSFNKKNLVVGDSSILALGNYLVNASDFIILGSGSCPLIKGITASFSSPNCFSLSSKLWNNIESGSIYDFDNVYIFHRSEYLKEVSNSDYILALGKFVNLVDEKSNAKIHIVFETQRLKKNPEQCISRLNGVPLSLEYCESFYPNEFEERVSIIKNSLPDVNMIFPIQRKYDVFDFKDSVHVTSQAFNKHYNFINKQSLTEK